MIEKKILDIDTSKRHQHHDKNEHDGVILDDGIPFGYKNVNGKLEIDDTQSKHVKKVFHDYEKYLEHPPEELMQAVLEEAIINGEELSYDDVEKRVSNNDIMMYITHEINQTIKEKDRER